MITQSVVEQIEDVLNGTWSEFDSAAQGLTEFVITNEDPKNTGGSGAYC